MTSWPDSDAAARRGWGMHVLLAGLIFLGWAFALAQVLTMDPPGSHAEASPGMQIFAHVKASVFGNPFAFESALSFCTTGTSAWGVADVLKSAAMWLDMILAMMLPVLLPLDRNASRHPRPPSATTAGLAGYIVAWLPFCAASVAAQWALQRQGLLSAHHVLQHDGLNASILVLVGLFYLARLAKRPEPGAPETTPAISCHAGLAYGANCLRCCGPLKLVMLVTGLMNIVAMLALTLIMMLIMLASTRHLSLAIGASALARAAVLGLA